MSGVKCICCAAYKYIVSWFHDNNGASYAESEQLLSNCIVHMKDRNKSQVKIHLTTYISDEYLQGQGLISKDFFFSTDEPEYNFLYFFNHRSISVVC